MKNNNLSLHGFLFIVSALLLTGCESQLSSDLYTTPPPSATNSFDATPTAIPSALPSMAPRETVSTLDIVNLNSPDNRHVLLKLPETWSGLREGHTYTILDQYNKKIGEVLNIGYYRDQPDGSSLPNHCEQVLSKSAVETLLGNGQIYVLSCDIMPKENRTEQYKTFDQIYAVIPIPGEKQAYNFSLSVPLGESADRYLRMMKEMLTTSPSDRTPEQFLKDYHLDVQFGPKKFTVNVPVDWTVKTGEYPVGLFWRLANVFSEDAGISLEPLKGSTVEVWQYALRDGLPARDRISDFLYPSNVNLLVKSDKVVGAWLAFNVQSIGPSVNGRYLEDITGLSFAEWSEREGIFISDGSNNDLAGMNPVEVLTAFFDAIENKDITRANACLDRRQMLDALTSNLGADQLYNPEFGENNSLVANIVSAVPISFKLIDLESREELQSVANLMEVEVEVSLKIQWMNEAFNNPDGKEIRYAYMKKYANGWKIGGLGTGP